MTVRYGIIGCGMMGREHIKNINLLPGTEVAAILEPDAGMQALAQPLAPNARLHTDMESFLAQGELDALVIVSPNYLHVAHLEQIAARVTLPILCEKPLYTDPADLARIERLHSSYGAPIWVAMEYRYMPPIARLIEQAEAVTGGIRMLTIREHRFPFLEKIGGWNRFNSMSGGTLVEKCCHFFDLMRLILKSDPVRVMASAGQDVNHLDEDYDGARPDIWDNGYVIVDFANGARAMLELCMFAEGAEYQEHIHAVGPAGKIECFVPGPTRFWNSELGAPPNPHLIVSPRDGSGASRIEVPVDPTLLEAGDHNGSTFYQHERFLNLVRHGGTPEVSLHDGIWAVRLGLDAQQSAREGMVVVPG